jgi:hypothetical protein
MPGTLPAALQPPRAPLLSCEIGFLSEASRLIVKVGHCSARMLRQFAF